MIFITGGAVSGKRTFAQTLGVPEADIVLDAHLMVSGEETDEQLEQLADRLASAPVVIAAEVGSGVHAVDAQQRAWRERAGRLSILLAKRAQRVVRMVCGIPTELKG